MRSVYWCTIVLIIMCNYTDGFLEYALDKVSEWLIIQFATRIFQIHMPICRFKNEARKYAIEHTVVPEKANLYVYNGDRFEFDSYPWADAVEQVMKHKHFNIHHRTVLFLHGFNSWPANTTQLDLGASLKRRGKYNFLTMDNMEFLHSDDYEWVVALSPHIGELLKGFIAAMYAKGMSVKKLHLVGNSIGVQIAAYAARAFYRDYGVKVGRITGLDPSAFCFFRTNYTINSGDADYVDVIRTSTVSYSETTLGHADFFVNNIKGDQPGCVRPDTRDQIACSHMRAIELFNISINRDYVFYAKKCKNILEYDCQACDVTMVGFPSDPKSRGNYFLKTTGEYPYTKGLLGLM